WEIATTSLVDWALLTQLFRVRRPLPGSCGICIVRRTTPGLTYFLCRYGTLVSLIGFVIEVATGTSLTGFRRVRSFTVADSSSDQVLTTQNNVFWRNMSIGCSSTLLMIPCIALWGQSSGVRQILFIAAFIHWILLVSTVAAVYSYTTAVTFIMMLASLLGIARSRRDALRQCSTLWMLLRWRTVMYAAGICVVNAIATIFLILYHSTDQDLLLSTLPAFVLSSMLACRCFAHLYTERPARSPDLVFSLASYHDPQSSPPSRRVSYGEAHTIRTQSRAEAQQSLPSMPSTTTLVRSPSPQRAYIPRTTRDVPLVNMGISRTASSYSSSSTEPLNSTGHPLGASEFYGRSQSFVESPLALASPPMLVPNDLVDEHSIVFAPPRPSSSASRNSENAARRSLPPAYHP
ncbi:hypothetical protein FRB99_001726, partial [Tulasnella sp. 403]